METLMNQAATGLITPHQTTASADAVGIKDALVDVEARAVSNSSSRTLMPEPAEALDPATIDPADHRSYRPEESREGNMLGRTCCYRWSESQKKKTEHIVITMLYCLC